MVAVGDHFFRPVPEVLVRTSCPFGGGVGGCHEEICGAFTGGVIMLGALWGRLSGEEDDSALYELVCRFRDRLREQLGDSRCDPIRSSLPDVEGRCTPVVKQATRILMELIEEAQGRMPFKASGVAAQVERE